MNTIPFMTDELYMRRALELARLGAGSVSPNPMVGAVIVAGGTIVGEGWHRRYGQPHAEVNAVASVADASLLAGATMYVTLEPCSHWGKTPPCADMIIDRGIPRVVVGVVDPNPEVAGRGIGRMTEAGIEVKVGVLEKECREVNKRFFTFQQEHRPYIILKWAQTSDGYLDAVRPADIPPAWMTGEYARTLVHRWRSEEGAVMVGTNTVLLDDPALTVRAWKGRNPVRVVPDERLRLDPSSSVFDEAARTILFTTGENLRTGVEKFKDNPSVAVETAEFGQGIGAIVEKLAERRITSLFIEGGAALLGSFLETGLWDEARIFRSSMSLADLYPSLSAPAGIPAPTIPGGAGCYDPAFRLETVYRGKD